MHEILSKKIDPRNTGVIDLVSFLLFNRHNLLALCMDFHDRSNPAQLLYIMYSIIHQCTNMLHWYYMKEYIQKLIQKQDLTTEEAQIAIYKMFHWCHRCSNSSVLNSNENEGRNTRRDRRTCARYEKAANIINPKVNGTLIDTCGTGGDSTGDNQREHRAQAIVTAGGRSCGGKARQLFHNI